MANSTPFLIDPKDLPAAQISGTPFSHTFKYIINNDVNPEVTISTMVDPYEPNIIDFDNISVEFGPGVHAIIGPAGSGKSATVAKMTENLDPSLYSLTTLAEPSFDSFYNIQDAFTHAFTKNIIFIDSLRIFMFEASRAATLSGGISAILPLLLSELTTFALRNNKVIFVAINTLDAKMYESLLAVTEGSVTSIITPKVTLNSTGGISFVSTIRSRYFKRQSFVAVYSLDSLTTNEVELNKPWYSNSVDEAYKSNCNLGSTNHGNVDITTLC